MKNLLSLFALILALTGFAQQPQLKLGAFFQPEFAPQVPGIFLGMHEGYYYYYVSIGTHTSYSKSLVEDHVLMKFDANLNLVRENTFGRKPSEANESVVKVFLSSGKIFIVTQAYNKPTKFVDYFLREVNINTLQAQAKGKLLFSYPENGPVMEKMLVTGVKVSPDYQYLKTQMTISRDSSKILFFTTIPTKKEQRKTIAVNLYSNEMELLFSQEYTMDYDQFMFEIKQFKVSNDGNVYAVAKSYREKKYESMNGKPNFDFRFLHFVPGQTVPNELVVDVGKNFAYDPQMGILDDGRIVCTGVFYYKESASSSATTDGVYYLQLDMSNQKILKQSFNDFPGSLDYDSESETDAKTENGESKQPKFLTYRFHDMVLVDDGGAILFGEQHTVAAITMGSPSNIDRNDVILIKLSNQGAIDQISNLEKKQWESGRPFYISYVRAVTSDKIYLIFNDSPQNINAKPGTKPVVYTPAVLGPKVNASVSYVTYDGQKLTPRQSITTVNEAKAAFVTISSVQIAKDKMLCLFANGKQLRLGLLTF